MPAGGSLDKLGRLSREAAAAMDATLHDTEAVRVVIRGALGTALVATDRRVLIWKKGRVHESQWRNLSEIAFGGGPVVRWVQVRGPSIGLVRPGILNVGELVDTIQLGEIVSVQDRAMLEMLCHRHARAEPQEVGTAPASPPGGRRVSGPDDDVLMEARGAGGRVLLMRDRVRIRHSGFRGLTRRALPASREVAFDGIERIDWHAPGALRLGRFRIQPRSEPAGGVDEGNGTETEVMFYLHQEPAFRAIKAEIERRVSDADAQRQRNERRQA